MESTKASGNEWVGEIRTRILTQLDAIISSDPFAKSSRRKEILSYVVKRVLDDPAAKISASTIATEVYKRTCDFDPDRDAIVRVEMARVRTGLDDYYASAGWNNPIRISIPKGSYTPVFAFAEPAPQSQAGLAQPQTAPRTTWRWWAAAAALSLALATGWHLTPRNRRVISTVQLPGGLRQPSVAPDGTSVAFVWDGQRDRSDIFKARIGTSGIARLTDGPEPNISPAWSPDGFNIAFQRRTGAAERAIYIAPANAAPGQDARLLVTTHTAVTGLAWTPDSRNLIVTDSSGESLGLYLIAVATGERYPLIENFNAFHPAVSPDGGTLAFLSDHERDPVTGVYTMPLGPGYRPSGPAKLLTPTLSKGLLNTRWSFDGRSIYYTRPVGIAMRYSLDSGRAEQMGELPEGITTPNEYAQGNFLYMRFRKHAFIGKLRAGETRPEPAFQTVEQDTQPDVSPDGRRMVFTSPRAGKPGLWFSDPDGQNATQVKIPVPAILPRWSADSREVCFFGTLPDGHSRVFLSAPGGVTELVTLDGADNQFPFFSRDGRYLYFSSNRNGHYQIWRMERPNSVPELLTQASAYHADESADGRELFYSTADKVFRMPLSDRREVEMLELPLPTFLRATANGLFVQVATSQGGVKILFQPFHPASPRLEFSPGLPVQGWSPLPSGDLLYVGLSDSQSVIERSIR